MIFLNAVLALGALAFTVPLAIHLLFRNRFEIVDWGAMRFLESVVRVNRRRLQLRNWLLLLVRCAIPILLAFCLARPVLTGWQTLPGDDPVSMVLAIDTSDSLAQKLDANTTRFNQLISTAESIVNSLPRGSDISLVTSGGAVSDSETSDESDSATESFASVDPSSMLTTLRSLRTGGPPLSLEALLSESLRKVSEGATARRQVVLLTDDSASDFSQTQIDALESVGERRSAQQPAPSIAWIDGWDSFNLLSNNRRITRLQPSQSASVPGQSVTWEVEARVDGNMPTTSSLDIRVNGTVVDSKTLSFRSGLARASFTTSFENVGRHAVEVAMPSEDEFSPDDRLSADYLILPAIDVWLVDGNPSDKPLQSDTDYLAVALSPFSLSGEKSVDLFRTTKVSLNKLTNTKQQTPRIIVLADVAKLSEENSKFISNFVENENGIVVVFSGPATASSDSSQPWLMSSGKSLLPLQWGKLKEPLQDNQYAKIDESRLTFPPLAAFARDAKGTLDAVDVMAYQEMMPPTENEASEATTNVVLRLDNGDPLVAISSINGGKVMQVATTANDRWTTLPRRLAFVPLMQRLFMHLAIGDSSIKSITTGQPIVIEPSQWLHSVAASTPKDEDSKKELGKPKSWRVTTPSGETFDAIATDSSVRFGGTHEAGVYRFSSEDGVLMHASVNVPDSELNRTPVQPDVRETAAKRLGATRYKSLGDYQSDDAARRFGRGVWRYVLLALLAALVVEPFLQQRGARVPS